MTRRLGADERASPLDATAKALRQLGVDDFDLAVLLTTACHMAGYAEVVPVQILQDGEE